jgi:hypothetical protein
MASTKNALRWVLTGAAVTSAFAVVTGDVAANARGSECKSTPAVVINAGTMTNTTNLDLSANGGTGIADASGGNNNLAAPGGGDFAGAGNGGAANAGASGGAIGVDTIGSGNNVGSAVGVGNTIDGNLCDGVPAVAISGGEVINETNIKVSADGGTAIADASGGDNNVAMGGGSAGNGGSVGVGNGGLANANANGGAVSIGEINSGSNTGNIVTVGNTIAGPWEPKPEPKPQPKPLPKPGPEKPGKPGKPGGKVVGKQPKVFALPATGAGLVEPGLLAALAAVGSVGAAGIGLRRR